jgi:hypothetical protein
MAGKLLIMNTEQQKHILSKSSFIKGVQCPKAVYLHYFFPAWRDKLSAAQLAKFNRGHKVGELARQLFPGGKDASRLGRKRTADMVAQTDTLIKAGEKVIYEAAFIHEGILAILDILVNTDGKWYGYEVKSSAKVSAIYELDASLQHYVITKSGLALEDLQIIYINEHYRREGSLDLQQLFLRKSVLHMAHYNEPFIRLKVDELKQVLAQDTIPQREIGTHCNEPYPCEFKGACWQHVPKSNTVFDIEGLSERKKFDLYYNGILHLDKVQENVLDSWQQKLQVQSALTGKKVVLKEQLQAFNQSLTYPRYYFHIESIKEAIPRYQFTQPYQQVPYMFSLHYQAAPGAQIRQISFITAPEQEPLELLLEDFLKYTSKPGLILVYNIIDCTDLLRSCLKASAGKEAELKERVERFMDLADPFEQKFFYHPAMTGKAGKDAVMNALLNISGSGRVYDSLKASQAFTDYRDVPNLFSNSEQLNVLQDYVSRQSALLIRLAEFLERETR